MKMVGGVEVSGQLHAGSYEEEKLFTLLGIRV
jgi:hypothetical protein